MRILRQSRGYLLKKRSQPLFPRPVMNTPKMRFSPKPFCLASEGQGGMKLEKAFMLGGTSSPSRYLTGEAIREKKRKKVEFEWEKKVEIPHLESGLFYRGNRRNGIAPSRKKGGGEPKRKSALKFPNRGKKEGGDGH